MFGSLDVWLPAGQLLGEFFFNSGQRNLEEIEYVPGFAGLLPRILRRSDSAA
jgi:hypothetical protein